MDTPPHRSTSRLAILATIVVGVVIVGATCNALWTPVDPGFSAIRGATGHLVVTQVAPDGRAWSADIRPGDTISSRGLPTRSGVSSLAAAMQEGTPTLALLAVAGLGLCFLALGTHILSRSRDRAAGRAYWRMSLCAGAALGLVPAGFHGLPYALGLQFAALRLFGPTLLDLTYAFPSRRGSLRPVQVRPLLWAPAIVLLLCYPFCWWRPAPLFDLVQVADGLTLLGYGGAACLRIMVVLQHPSSDQQRAQLGWFALGVILGLMPFLLLSVLPLILFHQALLAPDVSVYACALLLVCVGIAIVRADFLGVPRLAGRWTIRVALAAVLLTAEAIVIGFGAWNAAQEWNWPALATAVAASVLIAPGALVLWPRLTSRVERILLHDVYDPADTLRQFGLALAHADADAVGQLVVALVGTKLDLRFAVLLTLHEQYVHRHLRSPMPVMLVEEVAYRAQVLITTEPPGDTVADRVQDMPVLFLPIRQSVAASAVLCCGPKYSGEGYTAQDEALLSALVQYVAILYAKQQVEAQLVALQRRSAPGGRSLTQKELRILLYLAQGLTTKDIADQVDRDTSTVDKHIRHIRRKMGVHSSSDAIALARREGLLPGEAGLDVHSVS